MCFWKANIHILNEIIKFIVHFYRNTFDFNNIIKINFEVIYIYTYIIIYFVKILIMMFKTCYKLHFVWALLSSWKKLKLLIHWPKWDYRPTSTINLWIHLKKYNFTTMNIIIVNIRSLTFSGISSHVLSLEKV